MLDRLFRVSESFGIEIITVFGGPASVLGLEHLQDSGNVVRGEAWMDTEEEVNYLFLNELHESFPMPLPKFQRPTITPCDLNELLLVTRKIGECEITEADHVIE